MRISQARGGWSSFLHRHEAGGRVGERAHPDLDIVVMEVRAISSRRC
jgi:hypothetical protein